jgi:hypothetical protein
MQSNQKQAARVAHSTKNNLEDAKARPRQLQGSAES